MMQWTYGPGESADEGYFRGLYPPHVAKAFLSGIDSDEYDQIDAERERPSHEVIKEYIQAFVQRWGGVEDEVFVRVLRDGQGWERRVAIFAIGYSSLLQAPDLLVPFLSSSDLQERYGAMFLLVVRRDERVLQVLEEYLHHEPSLDEGGRWPWGYRGQIARIVATWGPTSLTAVLRKAFLLAWTGEQQMIAFSDYYAHETFLYALGRRGALAALHGIVLPEPRQRLAMIYLALGHLRADERFADLYHETLVNEGLQQEVASVLVAYFAFSEPEAQKCVNDYAQDYLEWLRQLSVFSTSPDEV